MSKADFFTIDEVIEATGFDRRTIAYYVQQGLLPKVGRRGRLTRYPRHVVDRLLFIKRLREAEASGERPVPMTLAEIRDALDRIPANELAIAARGSVPISALDRHLDPPDDGPGEPDASGPPPDRWRNELEPPPDLAPRASRMNLMLEETDEPDLFIPRMKREPAPRQSRLPTDDDFPIDDDDGHWVRACMAPPQRYGEKHPDAEPSDDDLEAMLTHLGRRTARHPPKRGAVESWTRVAVTPGLELAARDPDPTTRSLLDRIATLLRRRLADSPDRS